MKVNAHFCHVRRMQNDYLPPKTIHYSACPPGPDHQNAAGIRNWPRPLGPGLQYPGCSVGMHGVASHPSHLHYGAVHHPLPCKTSAQNAVVPRWLGNAKDAKVVIRFGQGWSRPFRYSRREVLQNSPLVPEGGNSRLANFVEEVLGFCETRRAFDKAPHVPIAATSAGSMFKEEV